MFFRPFPTKLPAGRTSLKSDLFPCPYSRLVRKASQKTRKEVRAPWARPSCSCRSANFLTIRNKRQLAESKVDYGCFTIVGWLLSNMPGGPMPPNYPHFPYSPPSRPAQTFLPPLFRFPPVPILPILSILPDLPSASIPPICPLANHEHTVAAMETPASSGPGWGSEQSEPKRLFQWPRRSAAPEKGHTFSELL